MLKDYKSKHSISYRFFLGITIVILFEILLRITGVYKTYTERIQNEYITHYDQGYPTWYRTWGDIDTFTLDHGEFRFKYHLNKYGIRERELPDIDTSAIRLFFFGDSFTEGVGVDYENAYPRKLEQRLYRDGYDASVYNLGMSGNDPFYNLVLLRDKFLEYVPTHVIFAVNDSDYNDYMMRGGYERFKDDGTIMGKPSPWFHNAYRRSHIVRFLIHLAGYDRALIKKGKATALEKKATAAMIDCLDSTFNLLSRRNINFLVLVHDTPAELCNQSKNHRIDQFTEVKTRFNLISLGTPFRNSIEPEICYDFAWRTDGHFNDAGYALLGNLLYESIEMQYPAFWTVQNSSSQLRQP